MQKNMHEFYCTKCDYSCKRKFLWEQHLSTQKHNRQRSATLKKKNYKKTEEEYICDHCGKGYKQRSGLWRHNKTCGSGISTEEKTVIKKSEKMEENTFIKNLENENEDLKTLMEKMMTGIYNDANVKNEMMVQMREQSKIIQDMIPRIGNNNNNRFNINVFLNEQCKHAINLSDFIQSLQIQLGDLIYTKDNGLIEGVSNVFVTALSQLDTFHRPIHCTDIKRETLYIKENNEWEKDETKEHIKNAINDVANKQRTTIKEWEEKNPNWENTDKGRGEYIKIVQSAMKDVTESPIENKIIKNIVKETVISKEVMSGK
jgi:hypothetical protein